MKSALSVSYEHLVQQLGEAAELTLDAEASGEGNLTELQRAQALMALTDVIVFLNADPALRGSTVIRPLSSLRAALHDVQIGARPPLFEPSVRDGRTKPTGGMGDHVRAHLAAALHLLIGTGQNRMTREAAARWLADKAKKAGVAREDGGPIETKQLLRWRDTANARKAPAETQKWYDYLAKTHRDASDGLVTLEAAQRRAITIVTNLSSLAHRNAPSLTNRN